MSVIIGIIMGCLTVICSVGEKFFGTFISITAFIFCVVELYGGMVAAIITTVLVILATCIYSCLVAGEDK